MAKPGLLRAFGYVLPLVVACSAGPGLEVPAANGGVGAAGAGGTAAIGAGQGGAGSGGMTASGTGGVTGGSSAPITTGGMSAMPMSGGSGGGGGGDTSTGGTSTGGSMEPTDAGMTTPPGECAEGDALDILRAFAPDDEDLAEDYEGYLSEEIASAVCATEGTGSARTITQTIIVPPGATYDGKGERLTADVAAMACDTSEGEQAEAQRPFFILAPGAQLKNVTITYPGCEGVHMLGDNVLDNIVWEDAGEDAASVRSYFPGGVITIKNSEGHKAADKMFQFNAPCDVRIEQFVGSDMGKLVRQNGGTEFELNVDLNTVTVTGVISAVVQSDSPLCFVRHHALSYMFAGEDRPERVFRDIPPGNVTAY